MKGKSPVTFLFIKIDPELVDVNIHPSKREVRFRDEFAVRQCVIEAVRTALEPNGTAVSPVGTSFGPEPDTGALSRASGRPVHSH